MSGGARCDEILRLIDEVLGDRAGDRDTNGAARVSRRTEGGDRNDA